MPGVFIGHYSASLLAKAAAPKAPLWSLVLAAQLVDVAWGVFIPLGIERLSLDHSLASNPLVLEYMPYSHSLLATLLWAGLAFVAARLWLLETRPALAISLVVLSHWLLDLVVHRPDLGLFGDDHKMGLGLWNLPWVALALEVALFLGAAAVLYRSKAMARLGEKRYVLFVGGLFVLNFSFWFGPTPSSTTAIALSGLGFFLAVSYWGSRVED